MTNPRAPGQKLLPIAADERFIEQIDAGLARAGYSNRSQFIRDAIYEKLARSGVKLSRELALAPERTGRARRGRGPASTGSPDRAESASGRRPPGRPARAPLKRAGARGTKAGAGAARRA